MTQTITIPPCSGVAVRLKRGDRLRVTDVQGLQVADLVAFTTGSPRERLSQGFTRMNHDRVDLRVGDALFSNMNRPLLRLTADTVGVHDLLFPPCNAFLYEHVFGVAGKTGCREHLTEALRPFGIGIDEVTDPFNVFMHTEIDAGRMAILPPRSRAGDHVELLAEDELIVAVSACAADVNDCNGGRCTEIELRVDEGA